MPRSGTSWLGQIINSSPLVSFRTEPLFSYRFKNILNTDSQAEEFNDFFERLVNIEDDFILQKDKVEDGCYPEFHKLSEEVLAFKTTRHFELLELYLKHTKDLHIIAIIRNPCAVINSWFNSYREFEKKGCNKNDDWRTGGCRKNETGEYWGFDDWLMSTFFFLELEKKYSNFNIINYNKLVNYTETQVRAIFRNSKLKLTDQTLSFIKASHQHHDNNPYSVFKNKSVLNAWEKSLDKKIKEEIYHDIKKAGLEEFINH